MESLSSFIGVDGTNTTLNSGRIQINLKPLEERRISASDVIRRLQPELAASGRHHAVHAAGAGSDGGGPREPHAVSVQPGGSGCEGAGEWVPRFVAKLQTLPKLRDVASDQQNGGLQAGAGDRPQHRVALRHHAADDRRHAVRRFGQRQISIMFTQLNQYRVVLEVKPDLQAHSGRTRRTSTSAQPQGGEVPLSAFTHFRGVRHAPLAVNHQGQFPVVTASFNLAPGSVARRRGHCDQSTPRKNSDMPASIAGDVPGHGGGVPGLADQ